MYCTHWRTVISKQGLNVCLPQAIQREAHWGQHALRSVVCRTATAEPGLQASLQELDALLVRCSTDCNALRKPVALDAQPTSPVKQTKDKGSCLLCMLPTHVLGAAGQSSRQWRRCRGVLLAALTAVEESSRGAVQAKQGPEAEAEALQLMEQLKARGEVRGFGGAQQVSGAGAWPAPAPAPCGCLFQGMRQTSTGLCFPSV